mmetsp:Transcript_54800/g.153721  ORF Transcript_54800/g.153721 Transcript_54800/m.153721 type:complete len:91 (+) Transcript_54800:1-273(+)
MGLAATLCAPASIGATTTPCGAFNEARGTTSAGAVSCVEATKTPGGAAPFAALEDETVRALRFSGIHLPLDSTSDLMVQLIEALPELYEE